MSGAARALAGEGLNSTSADRLELLLTRKRSYLSKIDIFVDLSPEEIRTVANLTHMATVAKGKVIYRQEDRAEGLFLLKHGRVRLSRFSPSGKKLECAVLEPGTFFGDLPLFGESMRNTEAEAIEESMLCFMSQADLERIIHRKPQVAIRMLAILGRRLAQAEARLEDMAYRTAPA
ncbi:MAG: cyclic nucleotide-binding domain-containing protein, partial [Chloroflexota bacterium]|nr:cyclic nucleotide-binding domain-containing protein [Chloroflexota bacterium]